MSRHALTYWLDVQRQTGWEMPRPAPALIWRLPVIRHVRVLVNAVRLARHEQFYRSLGLLPTGYDRWVLEGIRLGMEAYAASSEP